LFSSGIFLHAAKKLLRTICNLQKYFAAPGGNKFAAGNSSAGYSHTLSFVADYSLMNESNRVTFAPTVTELHGIEPCFAFVSIGMPVLAP
jgi:hypothetical protein